MKDGAADGAGRGGLPSILLVGSARRADLAALAADAGWTVVRANVRGNAEAAFSQSGARIAVVDARSETERALAVVRALANPVELAGGALLVVAGRRGPADLDRFIEAGATHIAAGARPSPAFHQQLRLAERHAERVMSALPSRRRETAPGYGGEERRGRDRLTGLPTVASARKWIERHLANAEDGFFVMLVAVARFELVNAAFGRETGDELLRELAMQIAPIAEEAGGRGVLVARTSGAEFIVGLAGGVDAARAQLLAGHIAETVERPRPVGEHLVTVSCRLGLIQRQREDADAGAMLRRASAALARARDSEDQRVHAVFAGDSGSSALDESLQADLRRALDRGEIELVYQPQVSVTTRKVSGVEALARWRHPVLGELGAVTLFAVAEESDYTGALSEHIQERAMAEAANWPGALKDLRLSVNVTAGDVARAGFAESFLSMVDRSGFPRNRLTVEITETGLMNDLAAAAQLLAELRAAGCRVAIDDFGTGYSSLAYLKALPLDYLKIDKRLADDIEGSARDRIVVRGVIDMARSLGLSVIAEGVETESQLASLAREGCNYYQGFLCAEPLPSAALPAFLKGWRA